MRGEGYTLRFHPWGRYVAENPWGEGELHVVGGGRRNAPTLKKGDPNPPQRFKKKVEPGRDWKTEKKIREKGDRGEKENNGGGERSPDPSS